MINFKDEIEKALSKPSITDYDKGNILYLAEKLAEDNANLKKQLSAVDKRLKTGNRNARIEELQSLEADMLSSDSQWYKIGERIDELKAQKRKLEERL